ncbi:hypothetical protein PENTCL1PPCAC_9908, partial [Pristionchus entomophagus]
AVLLPLAALVSIAAPHCTGSDHQSCGSWKRKSYCSNNDVETVKLYCGVTCGLCTTSGHQTELGGGDTLADCEDANT